MLQPSRKWNLSNSLPFMTDSAKLKSHSNHILPALVTPLTPEGKLDTASAERLIDHLYKQGSGGLYVTGSTGEGIYLEAGIRKQLVELSVSMSRGRGIVIAHVASIQGSQVGELLEHAGRVGADAVASIPPFVGGYSWEETYAYYRGMAEASRVPVLGYYIPSLTGKDFSLDQLTELTKLPNWAGFKCTDFNIYKMQRLLTRLPANQLIYHGADEVLAMGMQLGAIGGIGTTYNFMPDLIVRIATLTKAGKYAEAVAAQKQANEAIEVLLEHQGLAATKQILVWQGLIAHPTCAAPRASLTEAAQALLRMRLQSTVVGPTLVK